MKYNAHKTKTSVLCNREAWKKFADELMYYRRKKISTGIDDCIRELMDLSIEFDTKRWNDFGDRPRIKTSLICDTLLWREFGARLRLKGLSYSEGLEFLARDFIERPKQDPEKIGPATRAAMELFEKKLAVATDVLRVIATGEESDPTQAARNALQKIKVIAESP
jgi:hypothetical protein